MKLLKLGLLVAGMICWCALLVAALRLHKGLPTYPQESPTMEKKPELRIHNAANVMIPALLAIQQRGFQVSREIRSGDTEVWMAANGHLEAVAEDPVALLGIIALIETRGESWQASDLEIEQHLARYFS